ncbi:MAG: hypothetical protein M1383_02590 [Patescibacteria group bacterium]|nr:hypothetical protein [Patescibacteria group bacterium]
MKKIILISAIFLLSAGCNIFQKAVPAGVVKTVNGGADWQFSNAVAGGKNATISGLDISKLAFSPQNRETVFAGSYNGGLYKSQDSAASWANILSKIAVYDFAISPADEKVIYAAGYFGNQGKVLKTSDGGGSWQEIYNDPTGQNAVRSLALNPANPNQITIGTSSGNIIRSDDSGISWRLVANFSDKVNEMSWQNGSLFVLLSTKGLFKSSSTPGSFDDLTANLSKPSYSNYAAPSETISAFSQFYADSLSANLMYLTASNGLYKTVDGGRTWQKMALPVKQDSNAAVSVAVSNASSNIVFTNIGSTIYKSTNGGGTWQTQSLATTGYVNYILIDPVLPQIAYAGIYAAQ